jgi:hypothetical protein
MSAVALLGEGGRFPPADRQANRSLPMHTTDVPLSADERLCEACLPEDRRRQVAAILARGVLCLRLAAQTCPSSRPSRTLDEPEFYRS